VDHLRAGQQVELSSPVSDIQYTPTHTHAATAQTQTQTQAEAEVPAAAPFADLVKVTTAAGAVYYARSVVVTSSPHVLQRDLIAFQPPLSAELRAAVDSVSMHSIVKVFLKFSRPVWPRHLSGMIVSDPDFLLPEIWFRDVSHTAAADEPAKAYAVGFTTAAYAARLAALPRHEVLRRCVDQFDTMFALLEPRHMAAEGEGEEGEGGREAVSALPTPSSALLGVMYWDWTPEHHPYIGGGYCSPRAGADADLIDRLRLPYGNSNIFFAGEATNLPGATAHAALESGVRAAEQVAAVLSKQ
jgi:monoamine oxidase